MACLADGAARGQGNDDKVLGGWGAVFFGEANCAAEPQALAWGFMGSNVTNNLAEYRGALAVFQHAAQYARRNVVVQVDSQLVCNQINGRWACRETSLRDILEQIWQLQRTLEGRGICAIVEHVYREFNRWADMVVELVI